MLMDTFTSNSTVILAYTGLDVFSKLMIELMVLFVHCKEAKIPTFLESKQLFMVFLFVREEFNFQ